MHFFDEQIAALCGVRAAVIFNHIAYWVNENEKNDKNFKNGRFWTYWTINDLSKQFHYLTISQIRSAMKKLSDEGLIEKDCFNKKGYDRTQWYTYTQKGKKLYEASKSGKNADIAHLSNLANGIAKNRKCNCQESQMDLSNLANGFVKFSKPIPDSKTNNKSDCNEDSVKYGSYNHVELTRYEYQNLIDEFGNDTVEDYIKRMDDYCEINNKKYGNYDAAIRKWINEDKKKSEVEKSNSKSNDVQSDIDKYKFVINKF